MNYTIRKAVPADIADIVKLCAEHAEYERAAYSPEGKEERLSQMLFSDHAGLHCLIAENDGNTIGYATYSFEYSTWDASRYAHMDCLYLRPDARGYGVGEALVKMIARAASENSCSIIQWQTPAFNERAIKFYRRIGATDKEKLRFYLQTDTLNIP